MSAPVKVWRVFLIVAVVMAAAALVFSAFNFNSQRTETDRIRRSQLESCQKVGDPVLTGIVALVDVQIASSRNVNPKLFPSIPPAEFRRLVKAQQARLARVRDPLVRVPTCQQRFGK